MNPHRGKILVADDDPTIRTVLTKIFEKSGFEVIAAKDGKEAVERLTDDIIAVILDLEMPAMDGIECLQFIRKNFQDISPIMLTASEDISCAVEAMRNGAFDYITKPFNSGQLTAMVDKAIATDTQARRLRHVEAELAKAREQEIETASKIQQTLLMGVPPQNFKGLEVANSTIASEKVDGDFYDFIVIDQSCLDVVVGDVMGKGIASALLGAALKNYFFRVIHEIDFAFNHKDIPPPEPDMIVSRVQSAMIHQMEDLETFVTLCYARFDLSKNQMRFVDCGHMRTIHYHQNARNCSLLQGINMPLGFPETEPFTQFTAAFLPGDFFFFYSDGLTEAMNPEGQFFGEDRLVNSVIACAEESPEKIIQQVWIDIVSFSKSETFRDDFTSVVVKIKQPFPNISSLSTGVVREFSSDANELSAVRCFIRNFCRNIPENLLGQERVSMIELAVTEVASNIIRHGYNGISGRSFRISIRFSQSELFIEFMDKGSSFDPNTIPEPDFDGSQEGGFGLYIISKLVDQIVYSKTQDNTNLTRLKIHLDGNDPALHTDDSNSVFPSL